MKPFFAPYPKISLAFEEIIPNTETEERIRCRAVYADFIHAIQTLEFDELLKSYRSLAMKGGLLSRHFIGLNKRFVECRSQLLLGKDQTAAYEAINQGAMLIAQLLFVDNCVKEGLSLLLDTVDLEQLKKDLATYIQQHAREHPGPQAVEFYSLLYILQTAFDKLFVSDEEIVAYEPETGQIKVHSSYDRLTAYLELANRKVITACDHEKALCYNLTTGWGQGIDRQTWDELNRRYYDGGDLHFFSKYYHTTLEKMLPQFTYGRVRLAESLVLDWQHESELQVLEIGAGSGSFTLDLQMATQRLNIQTKITYLGVEPSLLKDQFVVNADRKTGGVALPESWRIIGGALEDVIAKPDFYINPGCKTVIVLSYCAHHCYHLSLEAFLKNSSIRDRTEALYILDGTNEHGWAKMYYMWLDVQSPENFDNLHASGIWNEELVWQEPNRPICGYAVTNAWCQLRKLT